MSSSSSSSSPPPVCPLSSSTALLEGEDELLQQQPRSFETSFENTNAIEFMHNNIPRLGHGSDMLVLTNGTKSEKEDYIRGLIAASTIIFLIVFLWLCLLLVFKIIGPTTMGVLSGRRVPLPPKPKKQKEKEKPNENKNKTSTRQNNIQSTSSSSMSVISTSSTTFDQEVQDWEKMYQATVQSNRIMKGFIIFAGLSIIVCAILLTVKGSDGLINSIEVGLGTITIVKSLLQGGIDLIDDILSRQQQTQASVDQMMMDMNTICPAVREELCFDLNDIPESCNFDGVFDGQVLKDTMTVLSNTRNTFQQELLLVQEDLYEQYQIVTDMETTMNDFDWALLCSMIFSLTLAVLCASFLFGACFQLPRMIKCLQNWILVPIFVVLVGLSWAFSMIFVIGSVGLADFCVDSPDDKLLIILNHHQDKFSSPIIYAFITFYISGCPLDAVPEDVFQQIRNVRSTINNLEGLSNVLQNGYQDILCSGNGASTTMATTARTISTLFCNAIELLRNLSDFFQCKNWYPLYENTVYSAMCFEAVDAFSWVTITQFIIVIMAMIIVTLRVAFYDIEIMEEEEEQQQQQQGDEKNKNNNNNNKNVNNGGGNDKTKNESSSSFYNNNNNDSKNNMIKSNPQQQQQQQQQPQSSPPPPPPPPALEQPRSILKN